MQRQTSLANRGPSKEFVQQALINPIGALAYMIMSSFGISLQTCMRCVEQMLAINHIPTILLCLTAAVQIRSNTVFVRDGFGNTDKLFPDLIISSGRPVDDTYNFGALHACGHILAELSQNQLARNILAKAGSCITGSGTSETPAGKINKEIADQWDSVSKSVFPTWKASTSQKFANELEKIFQAVPKLSSAFQLNKEDPTTGVSLKLTDYKGASTVKIAEEEEDTKKASSKTATTASKVTTGTAAELS